MGSDGTMLNPIFWKKVQGQKHPGRWEIVDQQQQKQIPKVTSIIREQDTIGKPKKTKSGIQPKNRALPRNTVL